MFPTLIRNSSGLSQQLRQDVKSDSAIEVLQTARRIPVLLFAVTKLFISLY